MLTPDSLSDTDWRMTLGRQFALPYFQRLTKLVHTEEEAGALLPSEAHVFEAFNQTPFKKVKVVLLGQDPYPTRGNPNGLAFSVTANVKLPGSLNSIFEEIARDLGVPKPANGDLSRWARQGVLLLNVALTVEEGLPGSHRKHQWWRFTNTAIRALSKDRDSLVFMLWGNDAKRKEKLIDKSRHHVLTASHPSIRSNSGFINCKHFSQANDYLESNGIDKIDWR